MIKGVFKTLAILIASLLLLVGLTYLATTTRSLSGIMRTYAERELEKAFGKEVNVGKISTNIVNRITFHNVTVAGERELTGGGVLFCEKFTINYNPFRLLLREPGKSVARVVLKSPHLLLTNRGGKWRLPLPEASRKMVVPSTLPDIVVIDGRITIEDVKEVVRRIEIVDISGIVRERDRIHGLFWRKRSQEDRKISSPIYLRFSGRSNQSRADRIRLEGIYSRKKLSIDLDIFNLDLANYSNLFFSSPNFAVLAGEGNLHLSFKTILNEKNYSNIAKILEPMGKAEERLRLFARVLPFSGELVVEEVSCRWLTHTVKDIKGSIVFDNYRIGSREISLKYGGSEIKVSGGIEKYLSRPSLGFTVSGNFQLSDLARIARLSRRKGLLPLEGLGKVSLDISGDLSNPKLKGWLLVPQAKLARQVFEELQGEFLYQDRVVKIANLQGKVHKGTLVFSGKVDLAQSYLDLDFLLDSIDLGGLLPRSWKDRTGGKGFASGKIFGKVSDLQSTGEATFKGVKFLGADLDSLSGSFYYRNKQLEIGAKEVKNNYKLNGILSFPQGEIRVTRLEILAPQFGWIAVAGKIGVAGGKELDLKIVDSYAEVAFLARLAQSSEKFSGRVNFLGKITGTVDRPIVSGRAWSSSLKIIERSTIFDSEVYYTEKILKVTSFRLGDLRSDGLTVSLNERIPVVIGSIETTNGDLRAVASLFSNKRDPCEKLRGSLQTKIDFSNLKLNKLWWQGLKARGRVSVSQPRIGGSAVDELNFGFNLGEQRLSIDRFEFLSGDGQLTGYAQMGMRAGMENELIVDTEWREYPIAFINREKSGGGEDSKGKGDFSGEKLKKNRANGSLNFRGKFFWKDDWEIVGYISSKEFEYNGEPLGSIGSKLTLNRKSANFSSFYAGSDLKGNFGIGLAGARPLTGSVEIATRKIAYFVRLIFGREKGGNSLLDQVKGDLHSKIVFGGSLENPQIKGYLDIERGLFSTKNFLFKVIFNCVERKINVEAAELKFLPKGSLTAKGKIDLDKSEPMEVSVLLENFDLSIVQSLFPARNIRTFGEVNGTVHLRGSLDRPSLKAGLEAKGSGVNNFLVDNIKTDFRVGKVLSKEGVEGIELVFGSFSADLGESSIRLLPESKIRSSLSTDLVSFSLLSEVRNINFSKLSIFGGLELNGTANFSMVSPAFEVDLGTKDLWINDHDFEAAKLRLSYREKKLFFLPVPKETYQVLGEVDFERLDNFDIKLVEFMRGKDKLMSAKGKINLAGPIELTLWGRKGEIPANILAELLDIKTPITGNSGFEIKLSGLPIRKEKTYSSLGMEGEIDIANGSIRNLVFENFNVSFRLADGVMDLKELKIIKKGEYAIRCWGTIPYPREEKDSRLIDFSLEMLDCNASVLTVLSREISNAKGKLDASLHISGTSNEPAVNGYFRMNRASVYGREVFKRIDDLNCDISVIDNKITVNELGGVMDRGEMDFKGELALAHGIVDRFDITFENMGEYGIPLNIPFLKVPQSSILGRVLSEVPCSLELKGKIRAHGNTRSYHVDGVIELENTNFTYPPRAEDTKNLNLDFLKPAIWNLDVKAGKNTWYENKFAEVQVQGHMRLSGPWSEFTVNGTISAVKGELSYLGATFLVKAATVECVNNELFLEVQAECPIEDDTIVLVVERGSWGKVKPKFVSRRDPQMSQQEAMLKATGLDSLRFSPQEGDAILRKELLRLIDSSLASPLIKSILKSTGLVDVVKVDAAFAQNAGERLTTPGTNERTSLFEGTEITFGKYLSSNLYLGYNILFEEGLFNRLELRHEVEVLYRLKTGTALRSRLGEKERYFGIERQIRF